VALAAVPSGPRRTRSTRSRCRLTGRPRVDRPVPPIGRRPGILGIAEPNSQLSENRGFAVAIGRRHRFGLAYGRTGCLPPGAAFGRRGSSCRSFRFMRGAPGRAGVPSPAMSRARPEAPAFFPSGEMVRNEEPALAGSVTQREKLLP